jgi:hypothetical protein
VRFWKKLNTTCKYDMIHPSLHSHNLRNYYLFAHKKCRDFENLANFFEIVQKRGLSRMNCFNRLEILYCWKKIWKRTSLREKNIKRYQKMFLRLKIIFQSPAATSTVPQPITFNPQTRSKYHCAFFNPKLEAETQELRRDNISSWSNRANSVSAVR